MPRVPNSHPSTAPRAPPGENAPGASKPSKTAWKSDDPRCEPQLEQCWCSWSDPPQFQAPWQTRWPVHPAPSRLSLETVRAHPDPSLCVTDPSSSVPVAQAFWCCCPTTRARAGTRGALRPGRTPGIPPASGDSFSSHRTAWSRRAQGQARDLCVRTGQREHSPRRGPELRNLAAP
jgi:hypothetical protein